MRLTKRFASSSVISPQLRRLWTSFCWRRRSFTNCSESDSGCTASATRDGISFLSARLFLSGFVVDETVAASSGGGFAAREGAEEDGQKDEEEGEGAADCEGPGLVTSAGVAREGVSGLSALISFDVVDAETVSHLADLATERSMIESARRSMLRRLEIGERAREETGDWRGCLRERE